MDNLKYCKITLQFFTLKQFFLINKLFISSVVWLKGVNMSINFNSGYSGMYGMSPMGMNSGMMGTGNIPQYYEAKYGCENCFRHAPYYDEYPKPIIPLPQNSLNPSWWQRFLHNVFGG